WSEPELLDYLISAGLQGQRHLQTKHLRGLEIDRSDKLDRDLHRKLGWLCAMEDAIDISGSTAKDVHVVWPVGKQSAFSSKDSVNIHRRYIVSGRCRNNWFSVGHQKSIRDDNQSTSRPAPKRAYSSLNFDLAMNRRYNRLHPERSSSGLEGG